MTTLPTLCNYGKTRLSSGSCTPQVDVWFQHLSSAEGHCRSLSKGGWPSFSLLPPATKLGQGNIFTPVCHSVHRGGMHGCSRGGHVCVVAPGGHVWLLWGGVHGCSGGVCVVAAGGHAWLLRGGVHGRSWGGACVVAPRGGAWLLRGGVCGCSRGACVGYDDIRRYGQWAGGAHPTGMHSCLFMYVNEWPEKKLLLEWPSLPIAILAVALNLSSGGELKLYLGLKRKWVACVLSEAPSFIIHFNNHWNCWFHLKRSIVLGPL